MKIDAKPEFPYSQFPWKLIHMEGKDMKDKKTCYFDSEVNMKKYIQRSNLKKKDYQVYTNVS
jgi:hypothetical protein